MVLLFYTFFKTLVGKSLRVELKNGLEFQGKLHSVDQYLNIKLEEVQAVDKERFPQLLSVKDLFVRGSVIRYIHVPPEEVDTEKLEEACRKHAAQAKGR